MPSGNLSHLVSGTQAGVGMEAGTGADNAAPGVPPAMGPRSVALTGDDSAHAGTANKV